MTVEKQLAMFIKQTKPVRYKFPQESESAIQEAAAFISNRTSVVIHDINEEMSREYMKAFYDMIRKGEQDE